MAAKTFEEWWGENFHGSVNGWEADNARVGWNAAMNAMEADERSDNNRSDEISFLEELYDGLHMFPDRDGMKFIKQTVNDRIAKLRTVR